MYDGACGTGGMLTVAEKTLTQLAEQRGKQVATHLYGQEINSETYAIAKADLLLKGEGEAADNIVGGPEHSTLSNDALSVSRVRLHALQPALRQELEERPGAPGRPRLSKADALGTLIEKFLSPDVNLSPHPVLYGDGSIKHPGLDNHAMGTIFEELVRRLDCHRRRHPNGPRAQGNPLCLPGPRHRPRHCRRPPARWADLELPLASSASRRLGETASARQNAVSLPALTP